MVFFYVKKPAGYIGYIRIQNDGRMVKRYRGEGTRWYTVKVHVINNERYHGEGCSDPTVDEDDEALNDMTKSSLQKDKKVTSRLQQWQLYDSQIDTLKV